MLTKILNDFLFGSSAPGGDFQSVLDDDMVPFEEDVQGFLRQILEALDFIHERNIAHLDIKVGRALSIFSHSQHIVLFDPENTVFENGPKFVLSSIASEANYFYYFFYK